MLSATFLLYRAGASQEEMPWGHMAIAMDRRTKEEDAVLLVAAADAGLSLRAKVDGRCYWAFSDEDKVPGCGAFTLQHTPSAGLCGIATRSFVRGECLLTERPLLHWVVAKGEEITPEGLEARLSSEGPPVQRAFWALSQNAVHGSVKHAFGIWLTNAHPTDGSNRTELDASAERSSAVFTHNARLNHSCSPVRRPAAQTLDCSNRIAPSCAGPEVHGRANGRDPPTGPTLGAESALQLERGAWRADAVRAARRRKRRRADYFVRRLTHFASK